MHIRNATYVGLWWFPILNIIYRKPGYGPTGLGVASLLTGIQKGRYYWVASGANDGIVCFQSIAEVKKEILINPVK